MRLLSEERTKSFTEGINGDRKNKIRKNKF